MSRETTLVVACAGGGRTRLESRPRPEPAEGEVLLRLDACGLCGTDLFKLASDSVAPGTVLGHEIVGRVVATGGPVRAAGGAVIEPGCRLAVPHHVPCGECLWCRRGSETMCPRFRENLLEPGGFSELVLVRSRAAAHAALVVPPGACDESIVFLEPAACVLRAIDRSGLGAEGDALVVGGGSMGLLHLLVARAARPACRVAVVDPLSERRELALELGADRAWSAAEASKAAREWTGGVGVDAVFDCVGGREILEAALAATRRGGAVVLFAHAAPGERAGFDLNFLFKEERRVLGTYSGALREQRRIGALIATGRLDPSPLVTARLPFSRFDEAVERARRHLDLKILLVPDREEASACRE